MKNYALILMCVCLCACQPGTGEFLPAPQDDQQPSNPGDNLLVKIQQEIFSPICSQCHIGSNAPAGLRLDNSEIAYQNLVNVDAVGNSDFIRVVPNEPDNSFLFLKILGDPRAGQRMPLGQPALAQTHKDLIRDWIQQGALPVSQSQQSKLVSVKLEHHINQIDLELQFDKGINSQAVFYESLPIYQIYPNQKILLPVSEYQFQVVGDNRISLQIYKNQLSAPKLQIEIGESTQVPLTDRMGQRIDVDGDDKEGGEYVIAVEIR